MKNIHVIPTEKPSRLMLRHEKLFFFEDDDSIPKGTAKNQNIYITNDEEIKEGWHFNNGIGVNHPVFVKSEYIKDLKDIYGEKPSHLKKIILTTDQTLISDGVQAIEDEFLQWFVNNPSCEEVEVIYTNCANCVKIQGQELSPDCCHNYQYKIILPKEELKETLEEAAEKYSLELLEAKTIEPHEKTWIKSMFIHIAKYQAERMYSEEEVLEIILYAINSCTDGISCSKHFFEQWFEQFKIK